MIFFTRSGTCSPAGFNTIFLPAWFSPAPAGYSPPGFLIGLGQFLLSAGCLTSLICIVASCFFTSFFYQLILLPAGSGFLPAGWLTGLNGFLTRWHASLLEQCFSLAGFSYQLKEIAYQLHALPAQTLLHYLDS